MAGPLNPAFWLNLATRRALPVEGGLTHQAWLNRAGNPERLGVTAAEAQTAHPDLATLRVSPRAIDITNLAPGPLTDNQLRRMNELLQELQLPDRTVRIGDEAGRGYRAPSLMELLGSDKVRNLEEFCGGGLARMAGGGAVSGASAIISKLLNRAVDNVPVRTISEWVGRAPTESVLNRIAEKENKLIKGDVYLGTRSPRYKEEAIHFSPEVYEARLKRIQDWLDLNQADNAFPDSVALAIENYKSIQNAYSDALKNPDRVYMRDWNGISEPKFNARLGVLMPDKVSSPEQAAVEAYRQAPGSFQSMARYGELKQADKDAVAENAIFGGSYPISTEDAMGKYNILRQLSDQTLQLKSPKLPLYRGLGLTNKSIEENLHGAGFGSFSYDPSTALYFVGGSQPSGTGVLTRLLPENRGAVKGLDISDRRFNPSGGVHNEVMDEYEVLLRPDQGFRVKNFAVTPDDQLLLDLYHDPDLVKGSALYSDGGLARMKECRCA